MKIFKCPKCGIPVYESGWASESNCKGCDTKFSETSTAARKAGTDHLIIGGVTAALFLFAPRFIPKDVIKDTMQGPLSLMFLVPILVVANIGILLWGVLELKFPTLVSRPEDNVAYVTAAGSGKKLPVTYLTQEAAEALEKDNTVSPTTQDPLGY